MPLEFNPLEHPVVFSGPQFMSIWSAWVEHFPFAFLLIDLARPRVLVELGTHQGDSYCAFCQGIVATGSQTKCFAVDTWAGDEHAGFYGDQVLTSLRAHHDGQYSAFSTLVRASFDDAVKQFDDGSIDLLHIDGLHTYEAVKHDFETWRSKLSDRAIVLFHDTALRDHKDFGVWKLWDELSPQHPSFEFPHGGGLGVLAIGPNAPQPFVQFLHFARGNVALVREFFAALGQRMLTFQITMKMTGRLESTWQALANWRQQVGLQPPLPSISMSQGMSNPPAFARMAEEETRRVIQDDLALRQWIQQQQSKSGRSA